MADTIEAYAIERGVNQKCLMHFTRMSNLASILQRGLLPRDTLALEGYNDFNDHFRYDATHAVCLTIGFPNYKMFFPLREQDKLIGRESDWVVLAIHPASLWHFPAAFCATNAASNCVTAIPLHRRQSLAAFKNMYADWGSLNRSALGIPDYYPTNPQAEVLMLNGVPRTHIYALIVSSESKKNELSINYPDIKIVANNAFFGPRADYSHWK